MLGSETYSALATNFFLFCHHDSMMRCIKGSEVHSPHHAMIVQEQALHKVMRTQAVVAQQLQHKVPSSTGAKGYYLPTN